MPGLALPPDRSCHCRWSSQSRSRSGPIDCSNTQMQGWSSPATNLVFPAIHLFEAPSWCPPPHRGGSHVFQARTNRQRDSRQMPTSIHEDSHPFPGFAPQNRRWQSSHIGSSGLPDLDLKRRLCDHRWVTNMGGDRRQGSWLDSFVHFHRDSSGRSHYCRHGQT